MLFKMLEIERAFKLEQDSMNKPRQIFVTQSRVLASKAEEYFAKFLDSLSTAEIHAGAGATCQRTEVAERGTRPHRPQ
jgi:hypothetical protein